MTKIIRVDMETKEITQEDAGKYNRYGGRAFIARFLTDEVDPTCEPLGIHNKLIFCTGLLGGTLLSSSGRLSVGGKSPLTQGIKEANAGGTAGNDLARHNIRAVIIERLPAADDRNSYVLVISDEGIRLEAMNELEYLGVRDTFKTLRARFGEKAGVICNGPTGERLMRGAGVAVAAPRGEMRFAARGGMGAVMGSKRLKAIVIVPAKISKVEYFDKAAFNEAAKDFHQMLIDAMPTIKKSNQTYGTSGMFKIVNELGLCPTRNFTLGAFDFHTEIGGEKLVELIRARGGDGKTGQSCMNGCMIKCLSVFPDENGNAICSTLQYENLSLLGSNLCLGSLDSIAHLNDKVNDLGQDAIEIGAALGVAAEAGLAEFGNEESFMKLLAEVEAATPLGRVIGNGVKITGEVLGINDLPMTKGQAMPAYDPRALKGNGVTFAMNPMGADHTMGNLYGARATMPPLATEGQGDLSRKTQLQMAGLETTGFCIFVRSYLFKKPELFPRFIYGICGDKMTVEEFWEQGHETARLEYEFNVKAGIAPSQDKLPEYMYRIPLPPNNSVFDLSDAEMQKGVLR
ncbi:MAG: aldehyde ferredoxin oxidoreductase C-terminal domain-containing protein [Acidobacteriota bacterium]|jgi:aldehyde:ferredoxin oxidoreductase|nr:aldehyde ferredoxin oxidoreductase C-terminal domain-containing protein [Acidobacteriota bacterium]NLT32813.1 aldehyde ferredoxin oxidoreductase [Acidobacteriota bacterium]